MFVLTLHNCIHATRYVVAVQILLLKKNDIRWWKEDITWLKSLLVLWAVAGIVFFGTWPFFNLSLCSTWIFNFRIELQIFLFAQLCISFLSSGWFNNTPRCVLLRTRLAIYALDVLKQISYILFSCLDSENFLMKSVEWKSQFL